MQYLYILMLLVKVVCLNAQAHIKQPEILEVLNNIVTVPQKVAFTNQYPIMNEGGHIQGVQWVPFDSGHRVFMSGSSGRYSYMVVIDIDRGSVINVHRLFNKPLKHAGGFQIAENILAVGIEDNDLRNYSQICFYDVSSPVEFSTVPVFSIEREGEFERATAGCVALARLEGKWLAIAGDWNTRHLDFYVSQGLRIEQGFNLVEEMTIEAQDRSDWVDSSWLPYQNINLWYSDSILYLIGMTSAQTESNIMDVFRLQHSNLSDFRLIKIASKELDNIGGNFIWGGGVQLVEGDLKSLIATPRNIQEKNELFLYPVEK